MNNIKKTYVLNLKKRIDKYNFMIFKLHDVGITNYEFFHGIDGSIDEYSKKIFAEYNKKITKDDYVLPNMTYIRNTSTYAIIFSFKLLFNKIISENDDNDYILILEDDIIFHKQFNLKNLSRYDEDVLYLGANQLSWNDINLNKNNRYCLVSNKKSITYGMYAIRYKVSFLKKFYKKWFCNDLNENTYREYSMKIRKPIDYLLWKFIIENKISNNVIFPNLIIPNLLSSNNMGDRNIHSIARFKKWNLNFYRYFDLEMNYYLIYSNLINNDVCTDINKNKNFSNLTYDDIVKIAKGTYVKSCFLQ